MPCRFQWTASSDWAAHGLTPELARRTEPNRSDRSAEFRRRSAVHQKTASPAGSQNLDTQIAILEARLARSPGDNPAIRELVEILAKKTDGRSKGRAYSTLQASISSRADALNLRPEPEDVPGIADACRELVTLVDSSGINVGIAFTQVARGRVHIIDGAWANCPLRMKLFNQEAVIASTCHVCFKVQILTKSVEDLIKLHFLLWSCKFPRDNHRKTMVETRSDVKHPYKGYVFCESEHEAEVCFEIVTQNIARFQLENSIVKLTHGCSEYGLKYPEFKYSPDGTHRSIKYPHEWRKKEKEFYRQTPDAEPPFPDSNTDVLTLRDALAFRTWVDYAELIGDEAAKKLRTSPAMIKPEPFASTVWAQSLQRRQQLAELRAS